MLLSSQFQGYCRDLHSEAVDFVVANVTPSSLANVVRSTLLQGRKLDHGNPNPGNLGSDFGRLGMQLWPSVHAVDRRNVRRQMELENLNTWRNAIAHQDWTKVGPTYGFRLYERGAACAAALRGASTRLLQHT